MTKINLSKTTKRININEYSFKEYAKYFVDFFDKRRLCIEKMNGEAIVILFKASHLPHLIGLQYAYDKKSNQMNYKGIKGFELLCNEANFTPETFRHRVNANREKVGAKIINWENDILPRIELLPCFLNSIGKHTMLKENIKHEKHPLVNTLISGDYFCFQYEKKEYLIMSILKTGKTYAPQTFIVNEGIRLLGALDDVDIKDIYWIKDGVIKGA